MRKRFKLWPLSFLGGGGGVSYHMTVNPNLCLLNTTLFFLIFSQRSEPLQTIGDIFFDQRELNARTYAEYTQDGKPGATDTDHAPSRRYSKGAHHEEDAEGNPKTFKRVLVRFAERTSMQVWKIYHVISNNNMLVKITKIPGGPIIFYHQIRQTVIIVIINKNSSRSAK